MKNVPDWFPAWAERFSELYYSGATAAFVLYGNVPDLVRLSDCYGSLADFLAEQIFGRWDLVLYYDLARGLRVFAGRDAGRENFFRRTQTRQRPRLTVPSLLKATE